MNKYAMIIALLGAAGSACAQDAPTQRYIDAQGVEIIQNRGALRPGSGKSFAPAQEPAQDPTRILSTRRGAAPPASAVDPKLLIGAREQGARDEEREAILRQELAQETRKFDAATRALTQAEQAARSQPQVGAVLTQLKEILHAHQQNIESLGAELRRTRAAR